MELWPALREMQSQLVFCIQVAWAILVVKFIVIHDWNDVIEPTYPGNLYFFFLFTVGLHGAHHLLP